MVQKEENLRTNIITVGSWKWNWLKFVTTFGYQHENGSQSIHRVHHPVLNFAVFSVSVPVCFKPRDHKIYAAVVLSVVCFTFKLLLKDKMSYPVRQCLFSSSPSLSENHSHRFLIIWLCMCVCVRVWDTQIIMLSVPNLKGAEEMVYFHCNSYTKFVIQSHIILSGN